MVGNRPGGPDGEVEPGPAPAEPFWHAALRYGSDGEYVDTLGAFVETGLAAGEAVMVAVPGQRLPLLRGRLDAAAVTLVDMAVAGRNPARIIPGVLHAFLARHPDRPVPDRRRTDLGRPRRTGVPPLRPARGADQSGLRRAAGPDPLCVRHRQTWRRGDRRRGPDPSGAAGRGARYAPALVTSRRARWPGGSTGRCLNRRSPSIRCASPSASSPRSAPWSPLPGQR